MSSPYSSNASELLGFSMEMPPNAQMVRVCPCLKKFPRLSPMIHDLIDQSIIIVVAALEYFHLLSFLLCPVHHHLSFLFLLIAG